MHVNCELLTVARESRGLTQTDLAGRLGVTQGRLSKIEQGLLPMPEDLIERVAALLKYPQEFFLASDRVYGLGVSELFHRKRYDVSSRDLKRIHANVNVFRMRLARILSGVDMGDPTFKGFDVDEFGDAESVARVVRAMWHLPPGPIRSVTEAIEEARGIVIPMDFGTTKVDAISQWIPGMPPLFFVSTQCPPDRLRFTLSHELGHMFMHEGAPNPGMEDQANRFAAEFLMPAAEIRSRLTNLTMPKLAALKEYWKVSMQALLKRASDLDAISTRQARSLWTKLNTLGYRLREPDMNIPVEEPTLYKEIADTYVQDMGYTVAEFARAALMLEEEANDVFWPRKGGLRVVR